MNISNVIENYNVTLGRLRTVGSTAQCLNQWIQTKYQWLVEDE